MTEVAVRVSAHGGLGAFMRRAWRAPFFRNKLAVAAAAVLLVLVLMVLVPSLFAAQDPLSQDLSGTLEPPSPEHLLGTDKQGRDVWSRIVHGTQSALVGALLVVLISAVIGIPVGLLSGYYGGRVDTAFMRGVDMLLAFPALLLAILIVSTFERGLTMAAIALGIVYVPMISRLVRSVTLVERKQSYVEAARAQGFPDRRIIFRHILPNIASPIIVQSTIDLAYAILDIAALSFLGLGVQPPDPDWGSMVAEGRQFLLLSPYTAAFAGLAIMTAVIAINLMGDGLRAQFDPRQREL
jgi:peptide/nickel transport system permease protein